MGARFVVTAALALVAVAACTAGAPPAPHPTDTPVVAASSASPVPVSCGTVLSNGETVTQTIRTLVGDQKSQNKNLEENWVGVLSGSATGQGQDLQSAVSGFTSVVSGEAPTVPSFLGTDMSTFNSDAQTFLSDQSGGLQPGWPAEAGAIEHDIKDLADDCKIKFKIPGGYTV